VKECQRDNLCIYHAASCCSMLHCQMMLEHSERERACQHDNLLIIMYADNVYHVAVCCDILQRHMMVGRVSF